MQIEQVTIQSIFMKSKQMELILLMDSILMTSDANYTYQTT